MTKRKPSPEEIIMPEREDEENTTCGECGVELTKENMWSDMTCKECAERLGLTEAFDPDYGVTEEE